VNQDQIADEMKYSRPYKLKKLLDELLPAVLVLLLIYLYTVFTGSGSLFYGYNTSIQYTLLLYFVAELIALFMLYEDNSEFLKNHWFDILLTVPFITAFKGLKGLKLAKSIKYSKLIKPAKLTKMTKIAQKTGKLYKKSKKQLNKLIKDY
jgi:hypothetical protein